MDLRDYPRPKDDTGIGVHWNAGFAAAIGLGEIEQKWLPELLAMGVKWVKVANHDGALDFVRLLLKHDIMPVVRLYRPQPNPGTLDAKALQAVTDYVAAGVRYFEFNNEPDLGVEWQGGERPEDAPAIIARNAIIDMEAILERGGYPAVPALAPGTQWDLVGEICRLGRRDLFAQPVWQAIHNYSLNHPLDYPYDEGNQQGAAYTADFYTRLTAERWDGDAWQGWSLERVNDERRRNCNPGATAFDDPSCWRSYERYDRLIRDQIGRSLPLLATENGFIVGERPDPRYPATTPQMHMAQTLEACRVMMGTSTRFDHAPDYYFCTAFWLLGNYNLGSWMPIWEGQAWYSSRWPDGRLPIVDALKAEPKKVRPWRGEAGVGGHISGLVRGGAGLGVQLLRGDGWQVATKAAVDERFEFVDVPLERYQVSVPAAGRSQEVTLTRERPVGSVNFDVTNLTITPESSVVRGTVRGSARPRVRLSRAADNWSQEQVANAEGAFRFTGLPAGTYTLVLLDTAVAQSGIVLDGRNEVVVDLAAPGWAFEVTDGGPGPGFGVVRCRVKDRSDVSVRLWTSGWEGIVQRTGSKTEYGADACEFAPLGAGRYQVQPQGLPGSAELVAEVVLDGSRVAWVTYGESQAPVTPPVTQPVTPPVTPPEPKPDTGALRATVEDGGPGPGFSVVRCRVAGQPGRSVRLWTHGWSGITQASGSKPEYGPDACEFAPLGPGTYFVEVQEPDAAGQPQTVRAEVQLEPNRVAWVKFERSASVTPVAPPPQPPVVKKDGVIAGAVTNGEGLLVLLSGGESQAQATVTAGRYRFAGLAAGTYRVAVLAVDPALGELAVREGIALDGTNQATVDFALPAPILSDSQVLGRVRGGAGRTLTLDGPEEAAPAQGRSTSAAPDETYGFVGLPAGTYRLTIVDTEPPTGSTQTHAGIALDGSNTVRIDFDLGTPGPAKTIEHYLLIGTGAPSKEDLVAVLRYVSHFRPVVGVDPVEARKARCVTILGGASSISAVIEEALRVGGAQVERIEADFAANLDRLIDEGQLI